MNEYPFLDNKHNPICDAELGDLVPPVRKHRLIDISNSPLVPARELRDKLDYLLMAGELDSALPVIRDDTLAGLIPVPDLEYALDKLGDEDTELCIMSVDSTWADVQDQSDNGNNLTDFSIYIDPVSLILQSQPKQH